MSRRGLIALAAVLLALAAVWAALAFWASMIAMHPDPTIASPIVTPELVGPGVTVMPAPSRIPTSGYSLTTYYIDTQCSDWVVWEQVLEPDGFYTERGVFKSWDYHAAFAFLRGKLDE